MPRSSRLIALGAVLALGVGALTGTGPAQARAADGATPTTARPAAAAGAVVLPHRDPFYRYSGRRPLARIARGTVLKQRPVTLGASGATSLPVQGEQLLYRTQDERHRPSVTVTTVVNPSGTPATKGLVAYLSFYDALGDTCDPSYTLRGGDAGTDGNNQQAQIESGLVSGLVAQGYAVTVPDFEGTTHHWVAGQESGWNTLDSLRATENYLHAPASTRIGLFGYSGGSIGGEFAAELAPTYAPRLNIVGAALGGLPVDLAHNLPYVNGSDDWSGVIPAVLVSLSRAFGIDPRPYESAYGRKLATQVHDECIGSFNGSYPGLTVAKLLKPRYHDFLRIPTFARIVNHLIMGRAPGHPRTPMFLGVGNVDGTGDHVMIENDVMALAHEYCGQGVPVQFKVYPKSEHSQAGAQFFPDAMSYLGQRLAGAPAGDNCAGIGRGNSLKPIPVRHRHHRHHRHG